MEDIEEAFAKRDFATLNSLFEEYNGLELDVLLSIFHVSAERLDAIDEMEAILEAEVDCLLCSNDDNVLIVYTHVTCGLTLQSSLLIYLFNS